MQEEMGMRLFSVCLNSSSQQNLVPSLRSFLGASLLLLWPHLLPLPAICSILATWTTLLFCSAWQTCSQLRAFEHSFTLAWNTISHGFWPLLKCRLLRVVSPKHPTYSIGHSLLFPFLLYYFFMTFVTFCHVICYSACLSVCVSLHLLYVFSFVKIWESKPTDLTYRRCSINIAEWTNRNVDILYLLVETVVSNEKGSFSSSIFWKREDSHMASQSETKNYIFFVRF